MNRLIIVSNRLPVTVRKEKGKLQILPSVGGLSTGLKGYHENSNGLWVGWSGDLSSFNPEEKSEIEAQMRDLRLEPLHLSETEIEEYYEKFSNGIIWPLFHHLLDHVPIYFEGWESYCRVNEKFTELICSVYKPGDIIWIHDYQLTLVPGMLRKCIPDARIGFFLHIPFPSSEIFRILPYRKEILNGLLGADLIGFQTFSFLRHFSSSLIRILGREPSSDRILHDGRSVDLGIFPISVDAQKYDSLSKDAALIDDVQSIRLSGSEEFIMLGVDRLDYTKGVPRRLRAIDRFFEKNPEYRGRVRFLQIAVPTRKNVEAYDDFRSQVNELVGQINGKYGTVRSSPVHYLYQSYPETTIAALYRAIDVMMVTPLRDGMNLVAKEFIATRSDENGVLILSEFAGAASELGEAIIVNPYDIDQVADAIKLALEMGEPEKKIRMRAMRERVFRNDIFYWAKSFIDKLNAKDKTERSNETFIRPLDMLALIRKKRDNGNLYLLLDYDGTLSPFRARPELAKPDKALMDLLGGLSRKPGIYVSIVSGRKKETMEEWFDELPLELYAEHGLWERRYGTRNWKMLHEIKTDWKTSVRPLLDRFASITPGAFVEEKTASLVWHYRASENEFGNLQAKELYHHLREMYSNMPVQILPGNKIIEVRIQGVNKGLAVEQLQKEVKKPALMVAFGDDHTDEDMFAAMPKDAITIRVGAGDSCAGHRMTDSAAVHSLLKEFLQD